MTHRDGFPHASRLGFSARSAWRGDAGHREPRAPSTRIGLPESSRPQDLGKPPFRSRGRTGKGRIRGRREALTMPRIARGSPPARPVARPVARPMARPMARQIARAISMGHYQRSLVLYLGCPARVYGFQEPHLSFEIGTCLYDEILVCDVGHDPGGLA